ncbi:alpha/beta fold hydrolase [Cohnella terricola]|uniref:Alpha/beta hydrolase n=1 Tax=Cohnella terricola TaxID=1289167 RepID=A0A559J6H9_9BACL|nr:alpha/beta hydrolase [Cohnella terricola]TVX95479.1 alpha/beta hydrolase [Cohnella terricola]
MNKKQLSTGLTLAYKEAGQGEPIVLLHGYCGSSGYWDELMPLLAVHGRVIAPDARGHGASSAAEGDGVYSMEAMADDVASLLDELGLKKASLFGHSMGGYAGLAFAEKYPERLQALGLIHSTAYPDTEQAKENRLKAAEAIRSRGVAEFVDGLVPKLFAPEHRESKRELVDKAKEIGCGTSLSGAAGCALGMRERPDRIPVLERLGVPVLLLAGESDEVIPPEKRFPVAKDNVTQVTLAGVGHMGMMENPRAMAESIGAFLERNRGAERV